MTSPSITVRSHMEVRGAVVMGKNEAAFPPNPKLGTMILKDNNLYGYLTIKGIDTWYPLIRDLTASYVHTQAVPSNNWTINHQLGSENVWYQIRDFDNSLIDENQNVPDSVDPSNKFNLLFNEPCTGRVLIVAASGIDVPTLKATLIEIGSNVVIDTSGMTIDGIRVITGTVMSIGDGATEVLSYTDKQRLNFVPGPGIELTFDNGSKSITVSAPGVGMTPAVVDGKIAAVVGSPPAELNTLEKISNSISILNNGVATLENSVGQKFSSANVVTVATANKVLTLNNSGMLPADITGNAATATNVEWTGIQNKPTTLAQLGITDIEALGGNLGADFAVRNLNIAGDILPTQLNQNIGSATARFKGIYVDDAYLSVNTLYLGDTPFLGTSQDGAVAVTGTTDQSVGVATTGTGTTDISSEAGVGITTSGLAADVNIVTSGVNASVVLTSAKNVEITALSTNITGDVAQTGNNHIAGGLTVTGPLSFLGDVLQVSPTEVSTADNIIIVNAGQLGAGVTSNLAGIQVDRGSLTPFQFVFNETEDMFQAGEVGQLETLASQNWVNANLAPVVHGHANATTTVPGFMSSTDKAKLDMIPTGDQLYTRAEVDAAIAAAINALKATLYSA